MNEISGAAIPTTRENILGVRIAAGIIDLILLAIVFIVMSALFGDSSSDDDGFNVSLDGAPFLIYVVISFAYYFLMENAKGQTLGKMAMKIKVVSLDGQPLTPGKVAVRTLLRIIDGFFFYLVAVVVIAISKNQQRLGDMAGGTTVVRAGDTTATDNAKL
jgi:uncharacterized RDD family membrane protein YckC